MHLSIAAQAFLGLTLLTLFSGCATRTRESALRDSMTLYASFDRGLDADLALGDKQLYGTGPTRGSAPVAGLPGGGTIQLNKGGGRSGDALQFTKKSPATVFFKGAKNFHYQTTNWSATISFWLKLDPDRDLEPGYCDPLQIASGNWSNGVFFAEFSKDETPRHFRFALRPLQPIWNPKNLGWEAIPVRERPMVQVEKPAFSRESWTHVVFTFSQANTRRKDGVGRLYLNGRPAGQFENWDLAVHWQPEPMQVIIGAAYVGLFDELALFNRALTDAEISRLYRKVSPLL